MIQFALKRIFCSKTTNKQFKLFCILMTLKLRILWAIVEKNKSYVVFIIQSETYLPNINLKSFYTISFNCNILWNCGSNTWIRIIRFKKSKTYLLWKRISAFSGKDLIYLNAIHVTETFKMSINEEQSPIAKLNFLNLISRGFSRTY